MANPGKDGSLNKKSGRTIEFPVPPSANVCPTCVCVQLPGVAAWLPFCSSLVGSLAPTACEALPDAYRSPTSQPPGPAASRDPSAPTPGKPGGGLVVRGVLGKVLYPPRGPQ